MVEPPPALFMIAATASQAKKDRMLLLIIESFDNRFARLHKRFWSGGVLEY